MIEQPLWGDAPGGKTVEYNIRRMQTLSGLDAYGVRLANKSHTWTPKERKAYEKRVRKLKAK